MPLPCNSIIKKHLWVGSLLFILHSCKKDLPGVDHSTGVHPVDLTISADSVILNPSGYAPLSAIVHYSYSSPGKTKIIVFGKHGENSNIEHMFNDEGLTHSVTIIGLYANYNNTVEVILFNDNNDSLGKSIIHIQTGRFACRCANFYSGRCCSI